MLTFCLLNHLSFQNCAKVLIISMHTVHKQAAGNAIKNTRKGMLLLGRVMGQQNSDSC